MNMPLGLSVNTLVMCHPRPYPKDMSDKTIYQLDQQVGYVLRRASQRHLSIFSAHIPMLTSTQFAVLARLADHGPLSQNHLGRETAMDGATIKGVVDRLRHQGLVAVTKDAADRRRLVVSLTPGGADLFGQLVARAKAVTLETLAPLSVEEQRRFLDLLNRLV